MAPVLSSVESLLAVPVGLVNSVLWNYVLTYGLLLVGLWFTLRLRGIQLRRFPHMLRGISRGTGGDAVGAEVSGGEVGGLGGGALALVECVALALERVGRGGGLRAVSATPVLGRVCTYLSIDLHGTSLCGEVWRGSDSVRERGGRSSLRLAFRTDDGSLTFLLRLKRHQLRFTLRQHPQTHLFDNEFCPLGI